MLSLALAYNLGMALGDTMTVCITMRHPPQAAPQSRDR